MVQRWAGSHDLPRSDRTLGPQVPVLTTVTYDLLTRTSRWFESREEQALTVAQDMGILTKQ